jgi:septin family protein
MILPLAAKIVTKNGAHFAMMVVGLSLALLISPDTLVLPTNQGESGLGKTTLINTLFSTELCHDKLQPSSPQAAQQAHGSCDHQG